MSKVPYPLPVPPHAEEVKTLPPRALVAVLPEVRACPVCANIGGYAAARCGHYWRSDGA